jgi:hypothetical protein
LKKPLAPNTRTTRCFANAQHDTISPCHSERSEESRFFNGLLAGIAWRLDSQPICIGGEADHVHVLLCLSKNLSLAEVVAKLKRNSSKWIKTKGLSFASFYWQNGYGAFSVSPSQFNAAQSYIEDQKEHHRRQFFQEEFRRFLN